MKGNFLVKQKGVVDLVIVAVMAFLVLGLSLTTKLVQRNQDNRSRVTNPNFRTMMTDGGGSGGLVDKPGVVKDSCTEGSKRCKSKYIRERCVNNRWVEEDCQKMNPMGQMVCVNGWCQNSSSLSPTKVPTPTMKPTVVPTIIPTPTSTSTVNRTIYGEYIDLNLDKEYLKVISDSKLKLWSERLDAAYEDYVGLTGWDPYEGNRKLNINSVDCGNSCIGWAWAHIKGDIGWARKWWQEDELRRINNNDDWSFGILHEISHSFDNYDSWGGFDNEMMSNFKMAYVLEKRNAKVQPGNDGIYYVGKDIVRVYKDDKDYGYDAVINKYKEGQYDKLRESIGNLLNYKFLTIKDSIGGWDTYKQVFRNLGQKRLYSNNEKLNAFLDEMTKVSKKDVRGMFNQEERSILELKFGKVFSTSVAIGPIQIPQH